MKLVVLSVNHANLKMTERECFYFRESDKLTFSTLLLDKNIDQSVILSTCNRSEVYMMGEDDLKSDELVTLFLNYFHQDHKPIDVYEGVEAINHLLMVACGLKSMVIGEDQILHQIREAYTFSTNQKFCGKELHYIFQNTLRFAGEMRKKYAISEHPLSVSYIGYQWLKQYLDKDMKIMICGIGEMARLMLDYLEDETIYLVNRTKEKVDSFLNDHRYYVSFEKRYDYVSEVDVIISATSSPHYVFKDELIPQKNYIFLDLAMPRDIDIQLKNREGCTFANMDDLQAISSQEYEKRQAICDLIEEEIKVEKDKMMMGLQEMKSDSLIQKMQSRYLDISEETFELLKNKLNLTSKEEYVLKKVLKTSFLRLLKDPVRLLKTEDPDLQKQYIQLVSELYDLKD